MNNMMFHFMTRYHWSSMLNTLEEWSSNKKTMEIKRMVFTAWQPNSWPVIKGVVLEPDLFPSQKLEALLYILYGTECVVCDNRSCSAA
jgi:hypothetical protein